MKHMNIDEKNITFIKQSTKQGAKQGATAKITGKQNPYCQIRGLAQLEQLRVRACKFHKIILV